MRKNTVEPEGLQMTIWRMRIACWTTKTTHMQSYILTYNLLIFHGNNSDVKSHQYYFLRALPVLFNWTAEFFRSSLWLRLWYNSSVDSQLYRQPCKTNSKPSFHWTLVLNNIASNVKDKIPLETWVNYSFSALSWKDGAHLLIFPPERMSYFIQDTGVKIRNIKIKSM